MLAKLSTEDQLIGLSMLMTLSGIELGAIFGIPNFIGITAILVIVLLLISWWFSKSQRLALLNYRPQAWGRAVVAGIFAGGSFLLSGVFWYVLLG